MHPKTVLKDRVRKHGIPYLWCLLLSGITTSVFAADPASLTATSPSGPGGLSALNEIILVGTCVTIPALVLIFLIPAVLRQRSTAQRAAKLQENQQRNDLALEAGRSGIWELNLTNNRLHWDRQTRDLFDVPPEETELTFESFRKRLHPEDRERVETEFNDSVDAGTFFSCDYRVIYQDGSVHNIHTQGRAIFDEIDKPRLFIGVCHEVTERRMPQSRNSPTGLESEKLLNRVAMQNRLSHLSALTKELSREARFSSDKASQAKDQPKMIAGRISSSDSPLSSE